MEAGAPQGWWWRHARLTPVPPQQFQQKRLTPLSVLQQTKQEGFFFFLTDCCQNPRATVPTWDALQEYAVGEGSSQPLSFSSAIRHGWSRGSFRWLLEGRTPLFPPKLSLVSGEQLGVTEDSQWGSEQHIPLTAPSSADGESIFVWREGLKILASCRVISKLECLIWCSYHLPGLPWWLSW